MDAAHEKIVKLNDLAQERGQSLAQMALTSILKDKRITSFLIGASSVKQVVNNVETLNKLDFSDEELREIKGTIK